MEAHQRAAPARPGEKHVNDCSIRCALMDDNELRNWVALNLLVEGHSTAFLLFFSLSVVPFHRVAIVSADPSHSLCAVFTFVVPSGTCVQGRAVCADRRGDRVLARGCSRRPLRGRRQVRERELFGRLAGLFAFLRCFTYVWVCVCTC